MTRRATGPLRSDVRGATIIEFAIVIPVMMMLLMGLGELCYREYVQSILSGAIQKAGRDSSIQGAAQQASTIDAKVTDAVKQIANTATFTITRKSYASFAIIKAETFYDTNKNNAYDPGECFVDVNGNKKWDADPGLDGQGGANEVTLYTVTMNYPRLFPVATLLGMSATQTLSASTLLKNQPYASQTVPGSTTICT